MYKVFVEYRVHEHSRDRYLSWMRTLMTRNANLQLYEGTDQPGLFVEIWEHIDRERYFQMKHDRAGDRLAAPWDEMGDFVVGGGQKIHIWHFMQCM